MVTQCFLRLRAEAPLRPVGAGAAGGGAVLKIIKEAASTTDEGLKTRTLRTGTIVTGMGGSGEDRIIKDVGKP